MHAVDTNLLVRVLTRDHAAQADRAEAFIRDNGPVWVSHIVLVETTWVLLAVYKHTPSRIAAMIQTLVDHESFTLQDPDVVAAALTHYSRRPTVGFSDWMILESARKAGHLPLATFERSLGAHADAKKL